MNFAALGFDAVMIGFEYALLAVGVYISFRILDMADLTVDGSFGLGLAISARFAVAGHPALGLVMGMLCGALAGSVTGLLITRARINPLLASIITMTGLYSVNIYVLGAPNVSLLDSPRIYEPLGALLPMLAKSQVKMIVMIAIVAVMAALLIVYFHTESGLSMRAVGDNEEMCRASSINTGLFRIAGLALANALVGLTGGLLAQYQGYADINTGTGMVIVGLASVIIGELLGGRRSVTAGIITSIVGSIIYRVVLQTALALDILDSNALKLITATLVALFMSLPALRDNLAGARERRLVRERAHAFAQAAQAGEEHEGMLDIRDLTKTFNQGTPMEHRALSDIDLDMERGEFACIVGSNGAGKSTLFNAIAGTITPEAGMVRIAGSDVTLTPDYQRARSLSRVFQDPLKGTAPNLTVAENVALAYGRSKASSLHFAMSAERRAFIHNELAKLGFGLEDRMDVKVGMLSGGQRQAVTLLMATIGEPDVLLLDEHTAALDPEATERILDLTQRITTEKGTTTLMITHNLSDALELGNRTLVMDEGAIVADISGEQREHMEVSDLLALYRAQAGRALEDDKLLLNKDASGKHE
ncbi:MAG: ATP-binding cassette domain-containing protein [Atopobiaceae bacterium]|nr:ATP-binding cassette domain-containing protein [Atopobiaceae bacterium]